MISLVTLHSLRSRVLYVLLVVTLAAGLPACSGDAADLTIYSGRSRDLIDPILRQFVDRTGLDIVVRYGGSAELALLIEQEGAESPADVFISQSPGALQFLVERGRLDVLPEATLARVGHSYRDPSGYWVGLSGRVRCLVYNTAVVEADLPQSIFDVVDDRFRGQVGIAPTNGSFQDFVTVMRSELGDERTFAWLSGLAENDVQTYASNNAIVEAVARGELAMGLVNHYYNERLLLEEPDAPTRNKFFRDGDLGSVLLVSGVGIVSGTGASAESLRFVDFLLGDEAQRYFTEETLEYPLAADLTPAVDLPPIEEAASKPVDMSRLGGLATTRRLIEQSGIESS